VASATDTADGVVPVTCAPLLIDVPQAPPGCSKS
jgi:hypothetical protein